VALISRAIYLDPSRSIKIHGLDYRPPTLSSLLMLRRCMNDRHARRNVRHA